MIRFWSWFRSWTWEGSVDKVADVPWGLIAFAALVTLNALGHLSDDALTGLGAAAGLLGLGHGIHTGTKHLRRSETGDGRHPGSTGRD
jgi:hypothetical protein